MSDVHITVERDSYGAPRYLINGRGYTWNEAMRSLIADGYSTIRAEKYLQRQLENYDSQTRPDA